MTIALPTGLLLVGACVLGQSLFSGSDAALIAANREALSGSADQGAPGPRIALELLAREDRLRATGLVGTSLFLVGAGTLASILAAERELQPVLWVTLLLTPVAMVIGEALPRAVSAHHADALAPLAARPIRMFQVAISPVLWALDVWSATLRRLPGEPPTMTRQGIVDLLEKPETGGNIDPSDRAMIRRLFELEETPVESCMTPLVDLVAIPSTARVGDAVAKVLQHGKSRLAVFEERVDNIVGIVDCRDLLFSAPDQEQPVSTILRPVRYVPESQKGAVLLRELRDHGEHLAVVVDEYGGAVGLVTTEDLLEEVVGEIRDERDKAGPGIRRLSERDWRVPARLELEEVSAALGHPLPEGDYETIAGLILARIGRIPEPGEVVRVGGFTFHIEAATDRAIQTVRLTTPG